MEGERRRALRVALARASATKIALEDRHLLDKSLEPIKTSSDITFPIAGGDQEAVYDVAEDVDGEIVLGVEFVLSRRSKNAQNNTQSIYQWLSGKLTSEELEFVTTSFDVIGDCVVIDIPTSLTHRETLIAEGIVATQKGVATVCCRTGSHSGPFRVQPVRVIHGSHTRPIRAHYNENGCRFIIDIDCVFFSPRLAAERLRISSLVQPEEVVGTFFAGVGPFPIVLGKHSQMSKAIAVELNPSAVSNLRENVVLNGMESRVEIIEGDVKQIAKTLKHKCNRIVMPIPHDGVGGDLFLRECLEALVPGGICHFYDIVSPTNPMEIAWNRVREITDDMKLETKLLQQKRLRRFGADAVQVVTDFVVIAC
eukprot:c6869_g1_i1.p1 GENE.c6869_g1_i1~~c6869_g1_i1.p1  ORF type:complete len:367 (+),score=76.37 c6869_g1_i1:34-1134(+)